MLIMTQPKFLYSRRQVAQLALGGLALGLSPYATAQAAQFYELPKVEYSAQRRVQRGERWQTMRVNYTPGKERMDLQGSLAGGNSIIVRRDLKFTWIVMPLLRAYGEAPLDIGAVIDSMLAGLSLTPDGQDMIDGVTASRYKVDGGFKGKLWLDKQNIPLKAQGQSQLEGVWLDTLIEQQGVKITPQEPSLFELPEGYAKIDLSDPRWSMLIRQIIAGR